MLHNDPECWNEITEWVEAAKVAIHMALQPAWLYGSLLQRYAGHLY